MNWRKYPDEKPKSGQDVIAFSIDEYDGGLWSSRFDTEFSETFFMFGGREIEQLDGVVYWFPIDELKNTIPSINKQENI